MHNMYVKIVNPILTNSIYNRVQLSKKSIQVDLMQWQSIVIGKRKFFSYDFQQSKEIKQVRQHI